MMTDNEQTLYFLEQARRDVLDELRAREESPEDECIQLVSRLAQLTGAIYAATRLISPDVEPDESPRPVVEKPPDAEASLSTGGYIAAGIEELLTEKMTEGPWEAHNRIIWSCILDRDGSHKIDDVVVKGAPTRRGADDAEGIVTMRGLVVALQGFLYNADTDLRRAYAQLLTEAEGLLDPPRKQEAPASRITVGSRVSFMLDFNDGPRLMHGIASARVSRSDPTCWRVSAWIAVPRPSALGESWPDPPSHVRSDIIVLESKLGLRS